MGSLQSITPGYKDFNGNASNINAGNNILPGDYILSGVIYKNSPFNKIKISNSEGGTVLPSTGPGGTQNYIYVHSPSKGNSWSGGIGCQLQVGFQDWSQNYAEGTSKNSLFKPDFYLI